MSTGPNVDPFIGRCRFTHGAGRDVCHDNLGQYVIGPDGEKVYGMWLLTPEGLDEAPLVVQPRGPEIG